VLKKHILLTTAYSAVFGQSLSVAEVEKRLLISRGKIGSELKLPKLITDQSLRDKRRKNSLKKLDEAQKFVSILKHIPWIKAVVVTGSVAVNNAVENDDTDFLIITQKNRLWLARPLVVLVAMWFGKRRQADGSHRDNSWCLNMFLDEDKLKVGKGGRSIYTAYEVLQAKFIFDRGGVEQRWLQENSWVGRVLPNFYEFRKEEVLKKVRMVEGINKEGFNEDWGGFDLLNELLFKFQYWYMKSRITREKVELGRAFFHPRDTRGEIFEKWKKLLLSTKK
jgi:hypothetical protein